LKNDDQELDDGLLLKQMKRIKQLRKAVDAEEKAKKWLEDVKNHQLGNKDPIVSFLATACFIVKQMDSYFPRDTQLVAILVLATCSSRKKSCMAEISTGEGKTLITALLAIYLSLTSRKDTKGCVNVVTSSSVLAEENVAAVQKLFDKFGVSVGNNCDKECSEDDEMRRNRYRNDVIYGDLSSFQRDELISRFFGRDVNLNRKADAVLVDEVSNFILFVLIIELELSLFVADRWTVCCWTKERTSSTCLTKFPNLMS
jgi:preprotein translocase subunit SecA